MATCQSWPWNFGCDKRFLTLEDCCFQNCDVYCCLFLLFCWFFLVFWLLSCWLLVVIAVLVNLRWGVIFTRSQRMPLYDWKKIRLACVLSVQLQLWDLQAFHAKDPLLYNWLVVSKMFYFHTYLGKWFNLTHMFSNGLKQPTRSTSQIRILKHYVLSQLS